MPDNAVPPGAQDHPGIPPLLARNVTQVWGADGQRWLTQLPSVVSTLARQWALVIGVPFSLTYHWVTAVTRADGTPAVLKLGVPGSAHLGIEAATLELYDGCGAVRLLAHDETWGALLLERADPGMPLTSLVPDRDQEATAVAVSVMRQLHAPPPPDCRLPHLTAEAASFSGHLCRYPGNSPLPRHRVERAGRLFVELCADAPRQAVLHGDLHHDNVLMAAREPWLAIDPHGVVGDPGYELGALLFNPDPDRRDDALLDLVPARLEQLADGLGLPLERAIAWGFVKAVLSEVWTAQDGGTPGGRALDVAQLLLPDLA